MASPFAITPARRRADAVTAWETVADVITDEGTSAHARDNEKTTAPRAGTRCVGCVENDAASVD
jgi:hypothetical protein